MWPFVLVLALCGAGFATSAGCHALAIAGALHGLPRSSAWALSALIGAGLLLATLTHPKGPYRGGASRLGPWECLEPMRPAARAAYLLLGVYSLVAIVASFPEPQERAALPAVLDEPYFLTATELPFAVAALAIAHSSLLLRKRSLRNEAKRDANAFDRRA